MQNLGQLLGKKFKAQLVYAQAVQIIINHWDLIMGNLANVFEPRNIYHNALVMGCSNPVWVSEIDFFKKEILKKVNEILLRKKSKVIIKDLKVYVEATQKQAYVKPQKSVPAAMEDKIKWNIQQKINNGGILCEKCQKIYSPNRICTLCESSSRA